MFANTDYPEQPSDWLEARPDKCVHIKSLEVYSAAQLFKTSNFLLQHTVHFLQMQLHWQNASVLDMAARTPDETLKARHSRHTLLIQSVAVHERLHSVSSVLLVGIPGVNAVAVVQKDSGYFCLQCSSQRSCRHVRAIQGDARAEATSVEARQQAHIQKFEGMFDSETGRRQVNSISQVSADIRQICMSTC